VRPMLERHSVPGAALVRAACGYPFELDLGGDAALCGACLRKRPSFNRVRAVMRYDDVSRNLVLKFKHADCTDAVPAFGRWLARTGQSLLAEADMVVPVPLHRFRLFMRRYNQAALLALEIERQTGVPAMVDLLQRTRATASQGNFDHRGRWRNVHGVFRVARPEAVRGKTVVVVDDVLTTGATVTECARALLVAGARSVDVLALVRVIMPVGEDTVERIERGKGWNICERYDTCSLVCSRLRRKRILP